MKIQKSSQDYLESMLMMQQERGYIRSIDVAEHLGAVSYTHLYSVDVDQDGLGGAGTPKYAFAENDSRLMVMATEQLEGLSLIHI